MSQQQPQQANPVGSVRLQNLVGPQPQLRVVSENKYQPESVWYGTYTEISESNAGITDVVAQDVMVGFIFPIGAEPSEDIGMDSIVLDGEERAQLYEVELKQYERMGDQISMLVSAKEWEPFQWNTDTDE